METNNFKEGLIEAIKVAGQMIIDNAEDIAGKTEHMSYLDISVNFDPENGFIPELNIYRSHLPSREKLERILDIFHGKKDDIDIETACCRDCGKFIKDRPELKYYHTADHKYICEDCKRKTSEAVGKEVVYGNKKQ